MKVIDAITAIPFFQRGRFDITSPKRYNMMKVPSQDEHDAQASAPILLTSRGNFTLRSRIECTRLRVVLGFSGPPIVKNGFELNSLACAYFEEPTEVCTLLGRVDGL